MTEFYVCPQHVGTGGYESCCNCGGWKAGDSDYGRLCTEAQREEKQMDEGIGNPAQRRDEDGKRADAARAAATETIGMELMRAFNHGKTDPSDMAVLGHSTMHGFEFSVERDGASYTISVTRDLDS